MGFLDYVIRAVEKNQAIMGIKHNQGSDSNCKDYLIM